MNFGVPAFSKYVSDLNFMNAVRLSAVIFCQTSQVFKTFEVSAKG